MKKLAKIMELLDISEEDVIASVLSSISPPNPAVTKQNWRRMSVFGNDSPETTELWDKVISSGFRCERCGSQIRLSFNHINSDATDHNLDNIEVLCFSCNRSLASSGREISDHKTKIAYAVFELLDANGVFPTCPEVRKKAGLKHIGSGRYFYKYLENRLGSPIQNQGVVV